MQGQNKKYISMILYDKYKNALDVALGEYKQEDIEIFKNGYIEVDSELARTTSEKLCLDSKFI